MVYFQNLIAPWSTRFQYLASIIMSGTHKKLINPYVKIPNILVNVFRKNSEEDETLSQ